MDNDVLFMEKQKFTQWWLWVILLGVDGLFLFGVFKQVIAGQQFGDKPISNVALVLIAALPILLTILFISSSLKTEIKTDGIYVKFFPFHLSFRRYPWNNISRSFIRKYNAITEYGGWDVRFGILVKEKHLMCQATRLTT